MTTDARADALRLAAAGLPLNVNDLAAILQIGKSACYRNAKVGTYDFLKLVPSVGPRCYSGVKVQRWLNGEPVEQPSFGRRRSA